MNEDTEEVAVSQAEMRRHNLSLAFTTIWDRGQASRAELARSMRLSKPAVARIVGDLIDAGYVAETGTGPISGRGRPATRLVPRADSYAFLGIDLRIDRITLQARDLTGGLLAESTVLQSTSSPDDLLVTLAAAVGDFGGTIGRRVAGVGVAVGGQVDRRGEVVVGPSGADWHSLEVPQLVRTALGERTIPVRLSNVANCAALANWREVSADPGTRDLLHLQIGIGAGAGWARRRRSAEEYGTPGGIAHLPLDRNGPTCTCGGRGCLNLMVGFDAFVDLAEPSGVRSGTGLWAMREFSRDLARSADQGNVAAAAAIEELAARVAQAAAGMITILRPSRFTIGGYPLQLGDRFVEAFLRAAAPHVPDIDEVLTTTGLGDDATGIGAYLLGVAAVAEDPLRLAATSSNR